MQTSIQSFVIAISQLMEHDRHSFQSEPTSFALDSHRHLTFPSVPSKVACHGTLTYRSAREDSSADGSFNYPWDQGQRNVHAMAVGHFPDRPCQHDYALQARLVS